MAVMRRRIASSLELWAASSFPRPISVYTRYARTRLRRSGRGHALAIGGVAALHIVLLWLVAESLRSPASSQPPKELIVTFQQPDHARAVTIAPPEPSIPVLTPPEIVIERDDDAAAIASVSAAMVLAPRPDPTHPNPAPPAREQSAAAIYLPVILKVLVLPDGSVADASVVRSSGDGENDSDAIAFVKTRWKFLPALLEGKPIRYWTTVAVRSA
jgi:TonB family protein